LLEGISWSSSLANPNKKVFRERWRWYSAQREWWSELQEEEFVGF